MTEDGDEDFEKPLLEELDIDIKDICYKIRALFMKPKKINK